jgi:osomolarity two-component system response regulator SKN7
MMIPTQQMDMMNGQLVAMQQQLVQLQDRYTELSVQYSVAVQELVGLTKTVVNHEHVMQNVMSFLNSIDSQRRRDSRVVTPFHPQNGGPDGQAESPTQPVPPMEDDNPASPLMHAAKLMSETNADLLLNPRNLEHMNEIAMRMNGTLTTPPPDVLGHRNGRPSSRSAPNSATSSGSVRLSELDNMVYPVGVNNGIDPMYSEHIHNIPYPLPVKPPDPADARQAGQRKKSTTTIDVAWIRQPQILLVEDDPTCRRIGGKFLYAFSCAIDSAVRSKFRVAPVCY